jgi:hypothetical protein
VTLKQLIARCILVAVFLPFAGLIVFLIWRDPMVLAIYAGIAVVVWAVLNV